MDEGHFVKNERTRIHKSVAALNIPYKWIITATAMMNKALDLKGYLSLLYRDEFDETYPTEPQGAIDVYRSSPLDADEDLHLLNPTLFGRLFSQGMMSAEASLASLPRIMRKLQLRRVKGAKMDIGNGNTIIIGANIPSYSIKTIEVPMTPIQLARYEAIHTDLVKDLRSNSSQPKSAEEEREVGGRFNMQIYRRLRHASLSVALEYLHRATRVKKEGNLAVDIAEWRGKPGGGLAWFLSRVIQDPAIPHFPLDREWIAKYLCNVTPKFPTFVAILNFVVIKLKERLIVFTDWPTSEFDVESFLKVLEFKVLVLRAGMSTQERSAIAAEFNNPDSNVEILLVTYATCSLGLNLHYQCNNVVCLELAINVNTTLQGGGRIHRLGQKKPQRIWILSGSNTFDRFVEYNATQKMISQVVGLGYESFKDLDLSREGGAQESKEKNDEASAADTNSEADELTDRANNLIQQLLGQDGNSNRLEWGDIHDLGLTPAQAKQVGQLNRSMRHIQPMTKSKKSKLFQSPLKPSGPPPTPNAVTNVERFIQSQAIPQVIGHKRTVSDPAVPSTPPPKIRMVERSADDLVSKKWFKTFDATKFGKQNLGAPKASDNQAISSPAPTTNPHSAATVPDLSATHSTQIAAPTSSKAPRKPRKQPSKTRGPMTRSKAKPKV